MLSTIFGLPSFSTDISRIITSAVVPTQFGSSPGAMLVGSALDSFLLAELIAAANFRASGPSFESILATSEWVSPSTSRYSSRSSFFLRQAKWSRSIVRQGFRPLGVGRGLLYRFGVVPGVGVGR